MSIQERDLKELEKLLIATSSSHNTNDIVDEGTVLLNLVKKLLFNAPSNLYK